MYYHDDNQHHHDQTIRVLHVHYFIVLHAALGNLIRHHDHNVKLIEWHPDAYIYIYAVQNLQICSSGIPAAAGMA